MQHTPLDFIVLGYPRSGTTWIANWLTTDRTLCLHDPFSHGAPETWPRDGRFRGISCTGAYVMPDWLGGYDCPIAVIDRDVDDCERSLRAIGMPDCRAVLPTLAAARGRRFAFDDLWHADGAAALWDFLLPEIPFDALRYELLQSMQVQPHMGKWHPDAATMHTVINEEGQPWRGLEH